jgi:hypothetical protein
MPRDSQKKLDRQPDSPKGKLTLSGMTLDQTQLAGIGINNPMQVIKFLNSTEGKELKSEIEKELALLEAQQEEMQFEQHEKKALLRRVICACLLKQMALHSHQAHAQQEAQLLREMLLDDPNSKTSPEAKHLTTAAHQLTPLYNDLDQVGKDLEALAILQEELKRQEDELNQHLKDLDDPELTQEQMDGMLEQLKKFFEKELGAFQNELNTDVAKSSQSSATPPVPQPQSQSQQKQVQQMRAGFSQRMLTEINKLTPASQPTPDNAAQQHLRQDPAQLKYGLKNIHTQVREQYDAMRTGLSEQKGRLIHRQDDLKRQIDLTQSAALDAVSKAQAKKPAVQRAAPTPSPLPDEPKPAYKSPTPFDTKRR